jgi:amidase
MEHHGRRSGSAGVLAEAETVFRELGAEIVPVSVPDVTQAVGDWVPACALEAAVAHRKTYPARKKEYGPVLASLLDAGQAVSALDYKAIQLRRMDLRGRFSHLHRTTDAQLLPVQPFAPLTLAEIRTPRAQPNLTTSGCFLGQTAGRAPAHQN